MLYPYMNKSNHRKRGPIESFKTNKNRNDIYNNLSILYSRIESQKTELEQLFKSLHDENSGILTISNQINIVNNSIKVDNL